MDQWIKNTSNAIYEIYFSILQSSILINNWALFLFFGASSKTIFFHGKESEGIKRNPNLQWKMCKLSTAGEKLTVQTGYLKWLKTGLPLCPLVEVMIIYLAGLPWHGPLKMATKETLCCYDRPLINTKVIISNKWSILEQRTRITFTHNAMFRPWLV